MKKSLLALAVMGAFAGAAQAQSSVTIYGTFDGGVRHVDNANAAGDSRTTMGSNGTYNSNRIGFKGVEDLGGGMNARFTLESGFNTGTGTLDNAANRLFNRTAAVGIGGAWGGVDFGRQYSVSFKTIGAYDPFSYKYVAIIPLAAAAAGNAAGNTATNPVGTVGGTRFDNDIQYTGAFGPVTVRAEYALGEQIGSVRSGSATAIGASFGTGTFNVGGAYTTKKPNVSAIAGTTDFQDNKQFTVGGAFKAGPVRVAAGYIDEQQEIVGTADREVKNAWAGVSYAITPAAEVTGAFYQTKAEVPGLGDGKRKLFIIGATYALSKRTNFYADFDYAKLSGINVIGFGTATTQDKVKGVSVGINHLF